MKVKDFDESHEKDLEKSINDFISDSEPEIIDIHFSVAVTTYGEEQIYCFSALIVYRQGDVMKKNSFLAGAAISTIGIIICKFIGLVYVIPFYAIIGVQGGALYSYAYSIYNMFLNNLDNILNT